MTGISIWVADVLWGLRPGSSAMCVQQKFVVKSLCHLAGLELSGG